MAVKISVIIPTYKRANLLVKCLDALAMQSIPSTAFEVIIVSDGPDQGTATAVALWQRASKIQVLSTQLTEKRGPAAARNFGWLKAKAGLVAFTDDDCLPHPHWLHSFLEQYHQEPMIAFTGKTQVPMPERRTDFAVNIAQLEEADFITANCACTKQALIAVGGFDERFEMAWREDSDLEFKLIEQRIPIVKCLSAVVVHPVREVPWGISIKEQKKGVCDALLYKKYPQLYKTRINASIGYYYLIGACFLVLIISIIIQQRYPFILSALALTGLFLRLIIRRLEDRNKSASHILEMVTTSLIIPFASIYWRFYGAIKYRVLFV